MIQYKMLDGNAAAVQAVSMAGVKAVSAYPITPQSSIAERLSGLIAQRTLDANYIHIESEHFALSCVLGAQLTGVRVAMATAFVGLALTHEICNAVSDMRVPLVMSVVNWALASPWSLWCDHQDSMAERDNGQLQSYCENVQEIYDLLLMACRTAEHEWVLLPAMVCFDGFFLSHSMQKVSVPGQGEVTDFVGPYRKRNYWLDPADPAFINDPISVEEFTEMKYQIMRGSEAVESVFQETAKEFESRFGRRIQMSEGYRTEDAETILIGMGSMTGIMKYFVSKQRKKGEKVGAVKVTSFRPFPARQMKVLVQDAKRVAVFGRSAGLGTARGPLFLEAVSAVGGDRAIKDCIRGLGGRDAGPAMIKRMYQDIQQVEAVSDVSVWIDTKENPTEIREVLRYV